MQTIGLHIVLLLTSKPVIEKIQKKKKAENFLKTKNS